MCFYGCGFDFFFGHEVDDGLVLLLALVDEVVVVDAEVDEVCVGGDVFFDFVDCEEGGFGVGEVVDLYFSVVLRTLGDEDGEVVLAAADGCGFNSGFDFGSGPFVTEDLGAVLLALEL